MAIVPPRAPRAVREYRPPWRECVARHGVGDSPDCRNDHRSEFDLHVTCKSRWLRFAHLALRLEDIGCISPARAVVCRIGEHCRCHLFYLSVILQTAPKSPPLRDGGRTTKSTCIRFQLPLLHSGLSPEKFSVSEFRTGAIMNVRDKDYPRFAGTGRHKQTAALLAGLLLLGSSDL